SRCARRRNAPDVLVAARCHCGRRKHRRRSSRPLWRDPHSAPFTTSASHANCARYRRAADAGVVRGDLVRHLSRHGGVLASVETDTRGRVVLVEKDVDTEPSLARQFLVRGTPTFVATQSGSTTTLTAGSQEGSSSQEAAERAVGVGEAT